MIDVTFGWIRNNDNVVRLVISIWLPIYGDRIYDDRPFTAILENDSIWVVEGTLKEGYLGGVPYIEIRKSDCTILKVTHGK